jgi:putative addiction module component (TIGR02574 family)
MSSLDQVLQAALALPEADRAVLIDELSATVAPDAGAALDAEWLAEIRRRSLEFDAGQVRPIPWEDVKRQAAEKHQPNG